MLNAFDKLNANAKVELHRRTTRADIMDFDLVTNLDNGKWDLSYAEVWHEAETTLRRHAVLHPLSNLRGESIQHVECDLGEDSHVNVVGLAEVQ